MIKLTKRDIQKFIFFWLPPLIWATVIFSFSARPTIPVTQIHWQDFVFKKAIHVCEYFIFTLLTFRAFKGSGVYVKNSLLYSFLASIAYGFTDEYHQSFTPGRDPKIRDVFFDGLGAFLAIYFITNILRKSSRFIILLARKFNLYD